MGLSVFSPLIHSPGVPWGLALVAQFPVEGHHHGQFLMTLRGAASQRDLDLLREWVKTELTGMEKLEAEREKSHDTSRQEAQRAREEQNKAVDARLTQLNGFKAEITQERSDYARRDYVDGEVKALDTKLTDSREDRLAIHARLETLAAVEQQVKVNSDEIGTMRVHIHDMAGDVQDLIARPPQFAKAEEDKIRRGVELIDKFGIDDGFTPEEMGILHDVAGTRKGKAATRLRRLSTLEQVLFSVCGSGVLYVIAQLVHFHPG